MSKKFLTVFNSLKEVHLYKDVGMIPYALSYYYQYKSAILYSGEKVEDKLYEEHVELIQLEKSVFKLIEHIRIIIYLIKNSRNFDILNLYHVSKISHIYSFVVKLLNNKIRIFIKCDLDKQSVDRLVSKQYRDNFFIRRIRFYLSKKIDIYSVESKGYYDAVKDLDIFKDKIHYLPNGFLIPENKGSFLSKENIMITVGRIGSFQKNNELLLQALVLIDRDLLNEWKFFLIGPVERDFMDYIGKFFIEYPHLMDKVVVTDAIYNKDELYKYYKMSRVFILTSRWESFGLVLTEAMYYQNYIVSTDLSASRDLTLNATIGALFENGSEKELSDILKKILSNNIDISRKSKLSHELIKEKFNWKTIAGSLDRLFCSMPSIKMD